MQLGFAPSSILLQDGFASWNASAADALDIWNGYLDFISAASTTPAVVPQISGDGINSAFFSNTIFGDSFDEGTLAVTVVVTQDNDITQTAEADVVVNNAFIFDSYRGPLQMAAADFHRLMIHEFGHVLGLDHVTNNPPGQAIMEPIISDLDHPADDDTLGIGRLYGAFIYNLGGEVLLRVGDSYEFSLDSTITTNAPTSYTVTGLPPGITFSPATRIMSGTATTGGHYGAAIVAHGPFADAYGSITFNVQGLDRVQGLLGIVKVAGYAMVADRVRPRIYAGGSDEISLIDTDAFAATSIAAAPGDGLSTPYLSISVDNSLLLVTSKSQQPAMLNRFDLESLVALPSLPIPGGSSPVLEGLESRDYVSDLTGVFQFDRTTGVTQSFFAATGNTNAGLAPEIAISTDGTILFVTEYVVNSGPVLATYDVTGPEPVLLKSLLGDYRHPIPSPDGKYLYYTLGDDDGSGQLFQAALPNLEPGVAVAATTYDSQVAVGPKGTIYEADVMDGSLLSTYSLYDPASLQQIFNIDLNHFHLDPEAYFAPFEAVFDASGKYLFVSTSSAVEPEVWAFSTDLGSFPVPVADPELNLLNISTRVRVEAGQDAMIGGFIIAGDKPKKILIRGLGPSLPLTGALSDPAVDLYDSTGKLIASNDNWISNRLNVVATALAPTSEREAAILTTLIPGAYTALLHDTTGLPGLGLVEIYDLDPDSSILSNISTRGKVETGGNVMIGGFVIGGANTQSVVVRAIGPSLASAGITDPLTDPVLELHDSYGGILATNDDWRATQESEIVATGLAPTNDKESAIIATLYSGAYTAIVHGQNNGTGVGLIEVYNVAAPPLHSK